MEISPDFTSVLAQAQKMMGISQIERGLGVVGNMAAVFPDVVDNFDADEIALDYWDRLGAPATGIRDTRQRDEMRAQRAQQKNAEMAAAMAPAVQQGADAARLLAEADTGDGSLLERMVG